MTSHLLPVEIASLRQQLAEARENLRLLQDRESEYVFPTEIPLQNVKAERYWQERISELEQQLAHPDMPSILEAADYAEVRARYLAALRERYGVVQTHAFMDLAQDAQVGQARQLPLLGAAGVYVPLRFVASSVQTDRAFSSYSSDEEAKADASPEVIASLDAYTSILQNDCAFPSYLSDEDAMVDVSPEIIASLDTKELIESRLNNLRDRRRFMHRESRGSSITLPSVLKLRGHLAIIGDAGAGKTTLLHVLATALSVESPENVLPADLLKALPQPRPLPVLLPLRQFELACGRGQYARTEADLLRFVDEWFVQWCDCVDLPMGFLAAHIRSGRAWLLLDALDEVADPDHRVTVRNVIQTVAHDYPQTRLIVTARVSGYRGATLNNQFTVVQVRDLDDYQRAQMICALYANLALPDSTRQANDLIHKFAQSDSLRDLGRTPVMVWTAAIIHALRGELPEGRAALYDAYVDILLKHSYARSAFDVEAVKAFSDNQRWPLTDRRHYLAYAAFEVHRLLEDQTDRHGDKSIVIGEDELADHILARYFKANLGDDARTARDRAREFVSVMVAHSGLLHETSQGYTIGDHLTMQEFLAGCYLGDEFKDDDAYPQFLADKVAASWWREVFMLAAGYLATRPGFAARSFLRQIAQQGVSHSANRLAALTLAARSLLQLRVQRPRPNWYKGLASDFAQALYMDLYGSWVEAPVTVRYEAGLALGLLFDDDMPDPRFTCSQGLPDFKCVEAGLFWMGEAASTEKDEKPRHRVYVDTFELARFPTTNAMYARFIAAGGYANSNWWGVAIKNGCWKDSKVQDRYDEWYDLPRYWAEARFNNPSQPVVGVNWYEANAYCAWLTVTLNDGHIYRLPTEAEWEKAARMSSTVPDGSEFSYPWGDVWQADHCNSGESGLETTSAVGIFPRGATPNGIEDLAGNVWEWCADWYGPYKKDDVKTPAGPPEGEYRVFRGGSWNDGQSRCRCSYRFWGNPRLGGNNGLGFRCVRILAP